MISIKVGNTYLDTFNDTSITFDLINPLFADEIGANSYSFSFNLPNTPKNRKALGYIEIILTPQPDFEIPEAIIFFKTLPLFHGVFSINEVNQRNIAVSFNVDQSAFAVAYKDKKMRDYSFGGVRDIGNGADMSAHANSLITQTVDDADYVFFPVANLNFYDGNDNDNFRGRMNYYTSANGFENNIAHAQDQRNFETNLVPFPYLIYTLKTMLAELGYSLEGTDAWYNDEEIRTLTMHNTVALDQLVNVEDLFPGAGYEDKNVNIFKDSITLADHMPDIKTGEALKGIMNLFGLGFFVYEREKRVKVSTRKELINSNEIIDWTRKSMDNASVINDRVAGFSFGYELDNDDSVMTDIKDVSNMNINESVEFDGQLPTNNQNDILETLRLVEMQHAYYKYSYDTDQRANFWGRFSHSMEGITVGNGNKEVTSIFSTIPMARQDIPSILISDWRMIPYTSQVGTSTINELGRNSFAPRLMFYRGMQPQFRSNTEYPLGSSNIYNAQEEIIANYSLFWDGEAGLYEKWWKEWAEARMNSKTFKQAFRLALTDIMMIDWEKKYRIRTRQGDTNAFVKKINITLTNRGLSPAQAEMIRM